MTATRVMIVVFFTSVIPGHETRFISARTSRRNCAMRAGPDWPGRSRRATFSGPSLKRALRGVPIGASGLSVSAITTLHCLAADSDAVEFQLAGVPGFEPGLSVLETDVLTVDTIPLWVIASCPFPIVSTPVSAIGNWQSKIDNAFTSSPCDQCVCGNDGRTC